MQLDAAGNWYPTLPDPLPITHACSIKWCVSAGVPSNDTGNEGDLVISSGNGTIYQKVNGVWVAFPGYSGSPGSNNLSGTTTPVGNVTPNYLGQYYLKRPAPYDVWISTGVTNTSWLLVVSGLT